jgi:sec-independent protein translocase protein TatA
MAAAGPFGLGPMELVIILLVLVMLFGATRLADLGGSLGKGIKEFRKAVKEEDEEEAAAPPVGQSQAQATQTQAPTAQVNGGGETVTAVKCPTCGALNVAGSKHCNQCGAAIVAQVT